jgi:signal transduction histidine kinase
VARLVAIQERVDDIINRRAEAGGQQRYLELMENVSDIVEELSEEEIGLNRQLLDRISVKIQSIFEAPPVVMDSLRLDLLLEEICRRALDSCGGRRLQIQRNFGSDLWIEMDRTVLCKVFGGILKNAIENTPDGGTIDVEAAVEEKTLTVVFRDTGVGIAAEDQKNIFGGFFHTQNTEQYSSKLPYQFNAGGTGSDLMRIKAFSARFGFAVGLTSKRCDFLQSDIDQCPGSISACPHVSSPAACRAAGGSTFRLEFPNPGQPASERPQ